MSRKPYDEQLYLDAASIVEGCVEDGNPIQGLPDLAREVGYSVAYLRHTIRAGRVDEDNLNPIIAYAYIEEFGGRVWSAETLHPQEVAEGWQDHGSACAIGTIDKQDEGIEQMTDGFVAVDQMGKNKVARKRLSKSKDVRQLTSRRKKLGRSTPTQKQLEQRRVA